jgi:uncharacterized protein YehS (DUF1456 family)
MKSLGVPERANEVRERLASRYGLERKDRINLARAKEYEESYQKSPQVRLERFLDRLEAERRGRVDE